MLGQHLVLVTLHALYNEYFARQLESVTLDIIFSVLNVNKNVYILST